MRIEHIGVYTRDIERLADFYVRFFGAKKGELYRNEEGFSSRFLTFGDGARLEIMSHVRLEDGRYAEYETGYVHIAISVGSQLDVDETTKRICAEGFELLSPPRVTGDGYYESQIADCDGNRVEITV